MLETILNSGKPIEVITFDLDDTLWDNKPTLDHAEDVLHKWLQENAPEIANNYSIDALKQHRKSLAREEPAISHDMTMLRLESLSRIALDLDLDSQLASNALTEFLKARNNVILYDDVIPVLTELSRNCRLVALSNGNADIYDIGLGDYFEFAIDPAESGASKPDPAMFHLTMERLNVEPEAILHIGDEPATDILGAHRAGVRSVWINRNNTAWPDEYPPPDVVIENLTQLLSVEKIFQSEGKL